MIKSFFKLFSLIPAIVMMYVIFTFSAQTAEESSEISGRLSYQLVQKVSQLTHADLEPWEIEKKAEQIHGYLRKAGHMTEYFLLAVSVALPLYVYGARGFFLLLLTALICIAYAGGDEYHQSFVSGRSPELRDVGIDSIGVFFGLVLVTLFGWPRKKKKAVREELAYEMMQDDIAYAKPKKTREESSDRLSEDMSLKKLIHDIREQKNQKR